MGNTVGCKRKKSYLMHVCIHILEFITSISQVCISGFRRYYVMNLKMCSDMYMHAAKETTATT